MKLRPVQESPGFIRGEDVNVARQEPGPRPIPVRPITDVLGHPDIRMVASTRFGESAPRC